MNIDHEIERVAEKYRDEGYVVVIRPSQNDLPPFAHDFKVELAGRRGAGGVLVAVKNDRSELADGMVSRYAEVTGAQTGWRFDLVILRGESSPAGEAGHVREFSGEDLDKALSESEQLAVMGFTRPAFLTAWAALESAMRLRLRAAGEQAGWGTTPREMLNELYSAGMLPTDEFTRLEKLYQLRNQIVHGFIPKADATTIEAALVIDLNSIARRLARESRPAAQPA